MKRIEDMYFSQSIHKKHHKRIIKQLETGNPKMKKDIHTIILREDGNNLFEYLELKEYLKIHSFVDFWLIGAVSNYEEFTEFITDFFNDCLAHQIPIHKNEILDYLIHGSEYDKNTN